MVARVSFRGPFVGKYLKSDRKARIFSSKTIICLTKKQYTTKHHFELQFVTGRHLK
jgi:hypothetical protein